MNRYDSSMPQCLNFPFLKSCPVAVTATKLYPTHLSLAVTFLQSVEVLNDGVSSNIN